jgi:hypothetical protein
MKETLFGNGAGLAGVSVLTCIGLALPVAAQCATSWNTSPPPNWIGGGLATCAWDPDGSGPLPSKLVTAYHVPPPPMQARQAIAALDTETLAWTTLLASESGTFRCMLPMPNGDLIVGGSFSFTSGPVDLARFDGTSWSQFGTATNGTVFAMARLSNGDVVVGGNFSAMLPSWLPVRNLARWDGTTWHDLALPGNVFGNTSVQALAVLPNGDLVVSTGTTLERILRWDGAAWHSMGAGLNGTVTCLTVLPDGSVFAGGQFTASGSTPLQYLARFDGTAWQPFGGGAQSVVATSTLLPNGDLLVGGFFTSIGGVPAPGLARWDGSTWRPLGTGLSQSVQGVSVTPSGRILAAGSNATSAFLATAVSACAPAVASLPSTCVGPAGPMTLAGETHPWLGATFASRAGGFTSTSLAVAILGFAPASTPLGAIHPLGLPACDLLASPDILTAAVPVAGRADYSIALPNAASLIGLQLFHQFAQVGLDVQGAIVSLSSSNALALTLGDY